MSDIETLFRDLDDFVNPETKSQKSSKKKYDVSPDLSTKKRMKKESSETGRNESIPTVDTDLDDLDGFLSSVDVPNSPKANEKKEFSPVRKKRCNLPSIAPVTSGSSSRCDSLRCVRCNFAVKEYDHYVWNSNAEYMFFRLNFPEKVHRKLRKKRGTTSYCCQCQWISVDEETTIFDCPNISNNWVCGGH